MSAFRVGQRVRKAYGTHNIGLTGIVTAITVDPIKALSGRDLLVQVDAAGDCVTGKCGAGERVTTYSWEWEPIVPEGHKPVAWSECLWQPEHERASA